MQESQTRMFWLGVLLCFPMWLFSDFKESPSPFASLHAISVDEEEALEREFEKEHHSAAPVFRYNRVEGVYWGGDFEKDRHQMLQWSTSPFFGFVGYAFSAKEFQYQVGLEKLFFEYFRFSIGAMYHRRIDSPDHWILSEEENTLSSIFLKEDFHDFYFREGGLGFVSQWIGPCFKMVGGCQSEDWSALQRNTKWALFGGKKRFRKNPMMDEGLFRTLWVNVILDTRSKSKRNPKGWYVQIEGEHAGGDLGGDFHYDRFLGNIRYYYSNLIKKEGIDFRLLLGSSHGDLPWQKSFYLGGFSTLRGYPYKAFPQGWNSPGGNRMILAQLEYRIWGKTEFGIFEPWQMIVFTDAGWVSRAKGEADFFNGFDDLTWKTIHHDVGIAIADRKQSFRIDVARRTDTGKKPYTVSFRIQRPF